MNYVPLEIADMNRVVIDLGLPISVDSEEWNQLGEHLFGLRDWGDGFESRVQRFYIPLFFWCQQKSRAKREGQNYFIGINGPQGGGKTTLAEVLCESFAKFGMNATTISIDDFYLPYEEQEALAKRYPENPYLQVRGYPGTHDMQLGLETLTKLKYINEGEKILIPRYDKSAHEGKGDRKPQSEWCQVDSNLGIVLFEGWMLGFRPMAASQANDEHLRQVNSFLPEYETWYRQLDSFIHLDPNDVNCVLKWRVEAEENMKKLGKAGMSQDEVARYIARFLPAYQTYLPGLRSHPLCAGNSLHMVIGDDRLPLTTKGGV